ncbi:Nicolin 1, partial [Phytophthora megakarya]
MTEVPIQISRLVVHPTSSASSSLTLVQPTAAATGSAGFKLSLLTSRKPPLHCGLVFCNFYVGYLRIVQVNVDGSSTELVTAYPLMQHLHYEDDAQNWQLVKLDQLPVSWNPHVFDSLCVYLSQPSPLWTTWELRDVNLRELAEDVEDTRSEATIT